MVQGQSHSIHLSTPCCHASASLDIKDDGNNDLNIARVVLIRRPKSTGIFSALLDSDLSRPSSSRPR
jgi:hypothetical protein